MKKLKNCVNFIWLKICHIISIHILKYSCFGYQYDSTDMGPADGAEGMYILYFLYRHIQSIFGP